MPEVSIVMPVYNGERFLRESIESVLAQTFCDFELILVDDCSSDTSLRIMTEYKKKDNRIHVYRNLENQGISRSLNIGFSNATGKYYTWTSDDNCYHPNAIARMVEEISDDNKAGLVYADNYYIDSNGTVINRIGVSEKEIWYNDCIGACFLYRAASAQTLGGYDDSWSLVQDYEYWLRFASKYSIKRIPEILYNYRIHEGAGSAKYKSELNKQLYKLRIDRLDLLLSKMDREEKEFLFVDMWAQNAKDTLTLKGRFFPDGILPEEIKWIESERCIPDDKQVVLFGTGEFGDLAVQMLGKERVVYYVDNNSTKWGLEKNGKQIHSPNTYFHDEENYVLMLSVGARHIPSIAKQVMENGVDDFVTYIEYAKRIGGDV